MRIETEWWQSFFSGLWLDVQRRAKVEQLTRAEADFIEKTLQLGPQAKVLDVPCGNGRLALELASRGYGLTGVDITQSLLDDARRKATERELEIEWERRDMRDLPWPEEFDGAFCFWGSFGYFDEESNAGFLESVYRVLKPGARFLLDTHVAETVLPRFQERDWWRAGDTLVVEERHWDHVRSRVDVEWTLVRAERVEKRASSIRIYTYSELRRLLERARFVNCEGYGSVTGEAFALGSERLYLLATKEGAS